MKRTLIAAALLAACAVFAFSQQQRRPVLGILPFTGGAGGDGEAIATLLSIEPGILENFTVVPRTAALNAIFAEHYFQLAGLTDSDTIAGIGRMLNADYVLSGNIRRLGDSNLVIASIINVESFEQVAGYHRAYRTIEEVRGFLPSMSRNMIVSTLGRASARLPSLAMLPFTIAPGIYAQDAETLSQILAIEILNTGEYVVLPRTSTIQAALSEMEFQMQGYTDDTGMAALGRAINADLVLSGGVHTLGALNIFTAQVLRVSDGSVVSGASRDYRVIADGVHLMAELAGLLTGAAIARPPAQAAQPTPPAQAAQQQPAQVAGGVSVPGATLLAQFNWLRANAASGANYVIELAGNQTIPPQSLSVPAGRNNVTVTLRGSGGRRTLSLSANGSLFTINSGVTLVLDDNVTLSGRNNNNAILVQVNDGGSLVMNDGSRITGNNRVGNDSWGSGVFVGSGGTFTMNGGEIAANRSFRAGGGVFVNGAFTMRGGTISGNTSTDGGGGVFVGGGANSRFVMEGGRIFSNTASGGGGGVFVWVGTFEMRGGEIAGNTSAGGDGSGGGVLVYRDATFRMSNGTIHGANAAAGLRNAATHGAALSGQSGSTIQRGTFNAAGAFSSLGNITTNNANTLRVVNGVLQ